MLRCWCLCMTHWNANSSGWCHFFFVCAYSGVVLREFWCLAKSNCCGRQRQSLHLGHVSGSCCACGSLRADGNSEVNTPAKAVPLLSCRIPTLGCWEAAFFMEIVCTKGNASSLLSICFLRIRKLGWRVSCKFWSWFYLLMLKGLQW